MEADVKISVIVVFYNAEQTIEQTLQSLALQNFSNAEYIFVNDGSHDRSVMIIREFMALHPAMSGVHRLIDLDYRRGSANATTVGIRAAQGEYVIRCDADDYLEPDALQQLWAATADGTADMVSAPYYRVSGDKKKSVRFKHRYDDLNDMPLDTLHFSLCNRLLRRKIIIDNDLLPFAGVDCWEDLGVVSRFIALEPECAWVDKTVYNYVQRRGSLTQSAHDRILREHLMMALLIEQWLVNHGMEQRYDAFLTRLKFIAKVKYMRGPYKDVAKWKQTFPEVNKKIMGIRRVRLVWRLVFSLVALLPTSLTQKVCDLTKVFYRK